MIFVLMITKKDMPLCGTTLFNILCARILSIELQELLKLLSKYFDEVVHMGRRQSMADIDEIRCRQHNHLHKCF